MKEATDKHEALLLEASSTTNNQNAELEAQIVELKKEKEEREKEVEVLKSILEEVEAKVELLKNARREGEEREMQLNQVTRFFECSLPTILLMVSL